MSKITRYAIRIKESGEYYNGHNTYSAHSFVFSDLQHAKMFKSAQGAMVACGNLYAHQEHPALEIVPIELGVNPDMEIIEYKYPNFSDK